MDNLIQSLFVLVFGFAAVVALFIALRQLTLWYFRLNQIADDIAVIANHYRGQHAGAPAAGAPRPQHSQLAAQFDAEEKSRPRSGNLFAP